MDVVFKLLNCFTLSHDVATPTHPHPVWKDEWSRSTFGTRSIKCTEQKGCAQSTEEAHVWCVCVGAFMLKQKNSL